MLARPKLLCGLRPTERGPGGAHCGVRVRQVREALARRRDASVPWRTAFSPPHDRGTRSRSSRRSFQAANSWASAAPHSITRTTCEG